MPVTTNATLGVIFKGAERFIHDYKASATVGYNTFVGVNAGNFTMSGTATDASYNTAVGYSSMSSLTSGPGNSAFGYQALFSNTGGSLNSAFGYSSLYSNTGGTNSAFGAHALYSNTTGYSNSAFGAAALYPNTTGSNNSAFGSNALYSSTAGNRNSAFGESALYSAAGDSNTAIGYEAGSGITTGHNNTCIGHNAQVPTGTSSNQVRIGNTSVTYAGVQVAWTITSDRRWKSNIMHSGLGLDFISRLRPVSYIRNNDDRKRTEYGFIAQDIEESLKEMGVESTGMLTVDDAGRYELRYNDLLAPMVKAIQELKQENNSLNNELESLKKLVQALDIKVASK
ncbi:MAG TPA: tail fiber domain-containing protein [Bacteroidota bacterium]|nr:tail fiber domain-containing protein [Bacteroidota bacterium]